MKNVRARLWLALRKPFMKAKEINIGLLGLGTVGSGVWEIFHKNAAIIEERTGLKFKIKKILVQDLKKKRQVSVPADLLTTHPNDILNDPEISIVVELLGGILPAQNYILQAIENGQHIVTANKALLSEKAEELFSKAFAKSVTIGFEASVAGGIPIIQSLREGFVGNQIEEMYGIINGTCNYILSEMTSRKADFQSILKEAQQAGYAEANPDFDVKGIDASQKLAILTWLAFGTLPHKGIYVEGIDKITPLDIEYAQKLGYVIKLLAITRKKDAGIEARVHPTMIPATHPLARVDGVFNAVFLKGDAVGKTLFLGRGAGMMPTASAVVADIIRAGKVSKEILAPVFKSEELLSIDHLNSEYYLRFSVVDKPGVFGQIAGALGEFNVGIAAVYQQEKITGSRVPIVVLTHQTREKNLHKALEKIENLEAVLDTPTLIRVLEKNS